MQVTFSPCAKYSTERQFLPMSETVQTIYIYTLSDPRDGRVRYVGQSKNPQSRYKAHKKGWDNAPKRLWFRELRELELSPQLTVIDCVSDGTHNELESKWIKHYLDNGCDLLNLKRHKTGYSNIKNPAHLIPERLTVSDNADWQAGENWIDTFALYMDGLYSLRSVAKRLSQYDWGCFICNILGGDVETGFILGQYMPQLATRINGEQHTLQADVRLATSVFGCTPEKVIEAFYKCSILGIEDVHVVDDFKFRFDFNSVLSTRHINTDFIMKYFASQYKDDRGE